MGDSPSKIAAIARKSMTMPTSHGNAQANGQQQEPASSVAQRTTAQVDLNYEAFRKLLPTLLPEHLNEYALMTDGVVAGFFATAMDAYRAGKERFGLGNFSMQKVIDRPVDLGYFSHAMH